MPPFGKYGSGSVQWNPETNKINTVNITPGTIRALYVRLQSTLGGGTVVAQLDDSMPLITVKRGNQQIYRARMNTSNLLTAIDRPRAVWNNSTTTSGTSVFDAVIPFEYPGMPNGLWIRGNQELTVTVDASSLAFAATGLLTGTALFDVIPIYDDSVYERYVPVVDQEFITKSASSQLRQDLTGMNYFRLHFREGVATSPGTDATQDITNLSVLIDGVSIYDGSYGKIRDFSQAFVPSAGVDRTFVAAATSTDVVNSNLFAGRILTLQPGGFSGILEACQSNAASVIATCDAAVTGYIEITKVMLYPSTLEGASLANLKSKLGSAFASRQAQQAMAMGVQARGAAMAPAIPASY